MRTGAATSEQVIAALVERGLTIAVAESLTGGMLVAELIATPGASATVLGGIVAYDTRLKHSLVGVDADLLARSGAVDPLVAEQMADRVRSACAVGGRPADVGISTTGVAGPETQDGHAVGTVYLGFAVGDLVFSRRLELSGGRETIRRAAVSESLSEVGMLLDSRRE